jgi:hypothetical protein
MRREHKKAIQGLTQFAEAKFAQAPRIVRTPLWQWRPIRKLCWTQSKLARRLTFPPSDKMLTHSDDYCRGSHRSRQRQRPRRTSWNYPSEHLSYLWFPISDPSTADSLQERLAVMLTEAATPASALTPASSISGWAPTCVPDYLQMREGFVE